MGSTVSVFRWDERRGQLGEVQMVSTLPAGFAGENSCAEILVHRTGRFVYASNRGHNSLAVFAADPASGQLTPVDHTPTQGQVPRNFRIDPSGNWLIAANQNSANLVVFRIDPSTGKLSANGETARVAFPVCVKFL
jgi:6-phosphogluconolactonase